LDSAVADWYEGASLVDSYVVRPAPSFPRDLRSLAEVAFGSQPAWIDFLLAVRDAIMGRMGLKTTKGLLATMAAKPYVGFFPILTEFKNEIVFGIDDGHLDFRLSLLRKNDASGITLIATSVVRVHNCLGAAYLFVITPFHKIIVRTYLARLVRSVPAVIS